MFLLYNLMDNKMIKVVKLKILTNRMSKCKTKFQSYICWCSSKKYDKQLSF